VAEHRHKRETNARRKLRAATVAAPFALLATATVVTVGVAAADPDAGNLLAAKDSASISAASREGASRAGSRLENATERAQLQKAMQRNKRLVATMAAVENADKRLWAAEDLNLWSGPGKSAKKLGELEAGAKVLVTGRRDGDREEVVVKGKPRWVSRGYLTDEKPITAAAGLSMEPCPDGSVENGLTDRAVYVYRSVCHAFPQISSYGGWDGHGEHRSGRALDIMTSDVQLGTAIAEFLRSHASELNLYNVIWRQRIYTQERGGEGWRGMASRGSATANHYDHVHVSTY
jgi:hypothetical protein